MTCLNHLEEKIVLGVVLVTKKNFSRKSIHTPWLISDGHQIIECLIPSLKMQDELLQSPIEGLEMQLIQLDPSSASGTLPILTEFWYPQQTINPLYCLPCQLCPVEETLFKTIQLIHKIQSQPLQKMVHSVFCRRDVTESYWSLPASKNHHHAWPGGLATHSLEVAQDLAAQSSLKQYELDLCIAAGLLHDIGKIWSYTSDMYLNKAAKALGHELIGTAKLESELNLLESEWADGAFAMRLLLNGAISKRKDGSMPCSLVSRMKTADQTSCERDRFRRNIPNVWMPQPLPNFANARAANNFLQATY